MRQGRFGKAAESFNAGLAIAPTSSELHGNLGRCLLQRGALESALEHLVRGVELNPRDVALAIDAAGALKVAGRLDDAELLYKVALDADPSCFVAHTNLGALHMERRRYDEAIAALTRAIEIDSSHTAPWINLGIVLRLIRKHGDARMCLEKALELDPGNAAAASLLGAVLLGMGRFDEARRHFDSVLRSHPEHVGARVGLAQLCEYEGSYDRAIELLEPAVDRGIEDLGLATTYARALRRVGRQTDGIAVLTRCLRGGATLDIEEKRYQALSVLANLHDDVGSYDEAWRLIRSANDAHAQSYDMPKREQLVDATLSAFSRDADSQVRSHNDSTQPVFIVGMPRSGTSLCEQILAAHPDVHALGESPYIAAMCRDRHPQAFNELSSEDLDAMASEYLAKAAAPGRALIITEKTPQHFLFLGAIERVFPRARIIHCTRDPLDTMLSCYFTDFASVELAYTYDLPSLCGYYKQYERVMRHWREHLTLPVLELRYETLVEKQEATTRALLAFLGLDWDASCLEFHRSKRMVRTSSRAQVRKPLYGHAVGRHCRYPEFTAIVREMLSLQSSTSA